MTIEQIETKIANLDRWLVEYPNHPNRNLVQNDKRCLQLELSNLKTPDINVNDPEVLTHDKPPTHE